MKTACVWAAVFASVAAAQSIEVAELSIGDAQKAMTEGRTTSKALVQAYLNRIQAFDSHGPRLNAVITLNPAALQQAEALDRERAAKGPRGPLHGIPVIVKDNYGTADMQTTAGTMALLGFVPSSDAFQVRKLREAGAVIIAKSNLHELASGITTTGSAFGQTLNPYDPTRNPGGSSGGTGAAIAASFAAAGMGSDTCGSIRIPSSQNNLVGLRPTKGLSSIAGIVPLSVTQDVGGPLTRTVEDLATMLDATAGEDPADAATVLKPGQTRPVFRDALRAGSLKGARIGTLEPLFGDAADDAEIIRLIRAAVEDMKKAGAIVIAVFMPELTEALKNTSVIDAEFQEDLANYLAHNGNPPVKSLAEIVEKGLFHAALETNFRRRILSKGRNSDEYRASLAKREVLMAAILKVMDSQNLDALAYPTMTRKPALIGDIQGGSNCQLSPTTGFPAISVQAGFTAEGLPVGVELLGRPFSDGKLVSYAYDYEGATHHRRTPALTPALGARTALPLVIWRANGGEGRIQANFTFDPATGELGYSLTARGFAPGDILSATLHRTENSNAGPMIAVFANRHFESLAGAEKLLSPDRERLFKDGLFLRVATKSNGTAMRIPLTPR